MNKPMKPNQNNIAIPTENQSANKIFNIQNANTVSHNTTNNTLFINYTASSNINTKQNTVDLSSNYYHLFVIGNEDYQNDIISVPKDRALSSHYTTKEIKDKYANCNQVSIKEMISFPALFVPETAQFYGKASEEQKAKLGFITDIHVRSRDIRFKCIYQLELPLESICQLDFELRFEDMDIAITELNHSHWAIKEVNLMNALQNSNINLWNTLMRR